MFLDLFVVRVHGEHSRNLRGPQCTGELCSYILFLIFLLAGPGQFALLLHSLISMVRRGDDEIDFLMKFFALLEASLVIIM